jgi:hypothetical protein
LGGCEVQFDSSGAASWQLKMDTFYEAVPSVGTARP